MAAAHEKISVTAKLAAYYRQFSDIPFAAEVATLIGAGDTFAQLARDHALDASKLTFYAPMFEARYKSITYLIQTSGASQVLELASGYSLRGLDLHGSLHYYVETDLADVVATKRALLDELRQRHALAPTAQHVVAVANALELDELRNATAVLDRSQPLLVLCEGLLGYLTRAEITRVAANVRSLLDDHHGRGSWLVPDFTFQSELRDLSPERIQLREAVTGITQRQLDASAFDDAAHLASFLAEAGFDVEVRSQVDETPSFASIAALGLSATLLDSLRPRLRVWVMTPLARHA